MICYKKLNNIKYWWIKSNNYLVLIRKVESNYSFFYLLMLNSAKTWKNGPKITKNVPKCPLFDGIWQYLTLLDFKKGINFLYKTNRLACFYPIWVPNSKTNTEYFWIIFFNRIICPSLDSTEVDNKSMNMWRLLGLT